MKTLAIIVSAGIAAGASAQVIFDNFGAGDTYQSGSGWTISGSGSPVGTDWDQGDGFTPSQGGAVATIEIAMGLVTGPNEFSLTLYDDNAGVPGTAIWSSGPIVGQMGSFGNMNPPIAVNVGGAANVFAGSQYWLVASSADTTWAAWNQNSISDIGPHVNSQNGGPWNASNTTRGAFRVTLVPSPAGLALLGMGGLVAVRRRR